VDRRPEGKHAINVAMMKEENRIKPSKLGITHVTTHGAMDFIMYGFQRVTRAATIARRVVTKGRPSTNTRKEVVDF
jgi:hypothetical protein